MSSDEPKRNTKKIVGLVFLIAIIVIATALVVINPLKYLKSLKPADQAQTVAEKVAISVKVQQVEPTTLQTYIQVNGDVVDTKTVDVYPEVVGNLTSIDVKVGDKVVKDQVIASIDPSKAGTVYKASVVKAPTSGTVLAVNFAKGATVSSQAPLARIGLLENLEVSLAIAERHIGSVHLGTKAEATFLAYPSMKFEGTVTRLSPVLNATSRTLEIGVTLSDPDHLVKAGMFPSVTILTEKQEGVLAINRSSILYEGSHSFVFIVDSNSIAQKRNLELGLVVDDQVEVTSGLEAGDSVVVQGQTLLTDGTSVQVLR